MGPAPSPHEGGLSKRRHRTRASDKSKSHYVPRACQGRAGYMCTARVTFLTSPKLVQFAAATNKITLQKIRDSLITLDIASLPGSAAGGRFYMKPTKSRHQRGNQDFVSYAFIPFTSFSPSNKGSQFTLRNGLSMQEGNRAPRCFLPSAWRLLHGRCGSCKTCSTCPPEVKIFFIFEAAAAAAAIIELSTSERRSKRPTRSASPCLALCLRSLW